MQILVGSSRGVLCGVGVGRRRRGFSLLEMAAVAVCLGVLTVIGVSTINSLRAKTHDRAKQASAANIVSAALSAAQSEQRKYPAPEDVVNAAAELGGDVPYKAIRDTDVPEAGWVVGVNYGPSLDPYTLSYAFSATVASDRMMGVAIRSKSGNCVMGRSVGNSSLTTWVVEQDLGSGCAGRFALAGEQPTPTYPTVPIDEYGAPQPPSGLAQQSATSTSITMGWVASPSPDVEFYKLSRNGVVVSSTIPASQLSYVDSGLSPGTTYQYRLVAVDATGLSSTEAGPADGLTAPATPSNLVAVPGLTPPRVDVSWAAVPSASYRLFANSQLVYEGPLTSFTHSPVADASVYSYSVVAFNASGVSDPSPTVNALTYPGLVPTPSAVRVADDAVTVSWGTHPGTISGYRLFKGTSTTLLVELPAAATSYTDSALAAATDVNYWIEAFNATGAGPKSPPLSSTTPPSTPTLEFVSASTSTMTVRWVNVAGATSYQVRRNGLVVAVAPAGAVGATSTHSSSGLTPATNYSFQIQACSAAGCSPNSAPVTNPTVPGAPTGLGTVRGTTSIRLSWVRPAGGPILSGYRVYRNGVQVATTSSLSETLTALTPNTSYTLYAAAFNSSGQSDSVPVAAATFDVPGAPVVSCSTLGDGTVTVSWTTVAAATGYRVYMNAGYVGQLLAGTTSFTATGLTNGVAYSFQVSSYLVTGIDTGEGAPSAPVVCTPRTVPSAPRNVVLTPTNLAATVSFTPPLSDGGAAVTGYTVALYRVSNNTLIGAGPVSVVASPYAATIAFSVINPTGTPAYARVIAQNAAGNSPAAVSSNEVLFTVPDAPAVPALTVRNAALDVSWVAPNDRGRPITGYTATARRAGVVVSTCSTSGSPPATTCTVPGLANGLAYDITVVATNAAGDSAPSPIATGTPATTPAAPTVTLSYVSSGTLRVTFTPNANGGSPIISYFAEMLSDPSKTCSATAASATCLISGLTNGVSYTARGNATNDIGVSPWANSNPVTPWGPPQVSGVTVTHSALSGSTYTVTVNWSAINWNGTTTPRTQVVSCSMNGGTVDLSSTAVPVGTTTYTYTSTYTAASGFGAGTGGFSSRTCTVTVTGTGLGPATTETGSGSSPDTALPAYPYPYPYPNNYASHYPSHYTGHYPSHYTGHYPSHYTGHYPSHYSAHLPGCILYFTCNF